MQSISEWDKQKGLSDTLLEGVELFRGSTFAVKGGILEKKLEIEIRQNI